MAENLYAVAAIVALFFALRLMAKVKDVPDDKTESGAS